MATSESDSEADFESADEGDETQPLKQSSEVTKKEVTEEISFPVKKELENVFVGSNLLPGVVKENEETKKDNLTSSGNEHDRNTTGPIKDALNLSKVPEEANQKVPEKTDQIVPERKANESKEMVEPAVNSRKILHLEKKLFEKNQTSTVVPLNLKSSEQLTDKEASVLERLGAAKDEKKSSPGWSLGWSSSFMSSAASSVSTFTSHVTQGIGTVLETVEATLAAPSPEEMAAGLKKTVSGTPEAKDIADNPETPTAKGSDNHADSLLQGGLLGGVTALTRVIESTGSKVITGGLDTLELIGKKTMDILTESDPGLKNTRTLFGGEQTTLSQILKESRDKAEGQSDFLESDPNPVNYSKLFDEFQGLVHLEALEMLSGQSQSKLENLMQISDEQNSRDLNHLMEKLNQICTELPPTDDTPDDELKQDFDELLTGHLSCLSIPLNVDKIKTVHDDAQLWIKTCNQDQEKGEVKDAKDIYKKAVTVLAEMTARSMEQFHKITELLLVKREGTKEEILACAKHLTGFTSVLCMEIKILASDFCQCLCTAADDSTDPDAINPLITNVYLEASYSNTYVQDAFKLMIPVISDISWQALKC